MGGVMAFTISSSNPQKEVKAVNIGEFYLFDIRWNVLGGGEHNTVPHGDDHHHQGQGGGQPHFHLHPSPMTTTASTFRPTTSLQHDNDKMTLMHVDTIILMVSCAFMFIIGESLRDTPPFISLHIH